MTFWKTLAFAALAMLPGYVVDQTEPFSWQGYVLILSYSATGAIVWSWARQ